MLVFLHPCFCTWRPQAGGHTDLLLLIVVAEKDASGAWSEVTQTVEWVMQQVGGWVGCWGARLRLEGF